MPIPCWCSGASTPFKSSCPAVLSADMNLWVTYRGHIRIMTEHIFDTTS